MLRQLFIAAVVLSFASPAQAHKAKSGWEYPPGCCSLPEKECHEIPAHAIIGIKGTGGAREYIVKLQPGEHPNVKKPDTIYYEPVSAMKVSGDSEHHACISVDSQWIYCLFFPAAG